MDKLNLFLSCFHTTLHEQLGYKIGLFNASTRGALILRTDRVLTMSGGIEQNDMFGWTPQLIRRSNPNGMEPLDLKNLFNKMANAIRIKWTTELLNFSRYVWDWIDRDPALAGVQLGRMLADQKLEEYLLRTFMMLKATVGSNPKTLLDVSKETDGTQHISLTNLAWTADMFGDAAGDITAWIMPTTARTEILVGALGNVEHLFNIGTVNVHKDAENRIFITSDDPSLRERNADLTMDFWAFGLRRGAVAIQELADFDEIYDAKGGFENIMRTYQANWSTKLQVLGYKFDEQQLTDSDDDFGKFASASDAALASPFNWTTVYDSHKQTAGVALRVRASTKRPKAI